MSDTQELDAIRRDIAELRAGLQALQTPRAIPGDPVETAVTQFKKILADDGLKKGIGVFRVIMLFDEQNHNVGGYFHTFGTVAKLPSEQALIEAAATFANNPLGIRALRHLVVRFLEGKPMEVTLAEWASALGVEEEELKQALAPLLAKEILKFIETGTGNGYYAWGNGDSFMTLLALA